MKKNPDEYDDTESYSQFFLLLVYTFFVQARTTYGVL